MERKYFRRELAKFAERPRDILNWNRFLNFIQNNEGEIISLLKLSKEFQLANLIRCGGRDLNLAFKIINAYASLRMKQQTLRSGSFDDHRYLSTITQLYHLECFGPRSVLDIALEDGLQFADVKLILVIVRHGYIPCLSSAFFERPITIYSCPRFWAYCVEKGFLGETRVFILNSEFDSLVTQLMDKRVMKNVQMGRGFHRSIFVLWVLQAVVLQRNDDPCTQSYVECIRLFFSTTSETFVSKDEVREFMSDLLKGDDYYQVVENFADDYASLFQAESSRAQGPRSLKRLCRCSVREILALTPDELPESVYTFDIPTTLKDFLLGEPEFLS